MRVILTHEQADFDALGSLLGSALLDEQSIPVLPRRLNRNARAFITLYGSELPFVDGRYLPSETVEVATLVDTQSLITLKGMTRKTQVQVIDHHPIRPDLPEPWTVTTSPLGSCTTFFVERLREQNGDLSIVQASLLLLGIYEDTGSLTYASTTSCDVRAAAFLLEQGASLRILNEFLNPPLSEEQRRIYDRLLAVAETFTINGQKIVTARCIGEDTTEEISSVAHKLRDLMDPDALFLLVHTSEGIRLVARSTTDQVNVAEVAARFGGGGHDRAASALIHPENLPMTSEDPSPLEFVYRNLILILPEFVLPSITVAQLMSPQPLVISPTTLAKDASMLMQRYGYEGYPVVENDKVIGLLTRRAVDRALSHKLNLPVASLMEAGEVIVAPGDSVEHLQGVMTSTGWGQVPVVDPETCKIIGIVTRTDLLKTLSHSTTLTERQNLASQLEAALPPARLALLKVIASQAHDRHMAIYLVGGFVRDLLLERPSLDFDLVVEGDAISLGRRLAQLFGGRIVSHQRFGTAKWRIAEIRTELTRQFSQLMSDSQGGPWEGLNPQDLPESLDLISARTEFYDYPTALPTVERSSIKLDLHRRDFTINTMALRLDGRHYGELYDYWGGLLDLRRGLVRVLHSLSFVDDPTRMLRAVRFEQRFGFRIESRTLQLIGEALDLTRQVSGDRIRHELDLMFQETKPAAMLDRLQELGLLSAIHPDLCWQQELGPILIAVLREPIDPLWGCSQEVVQGLERRRLGYLVVSLKLPLEKINSISTRLHFSHHLKKELIAVCTLTRRLPDLLNKSPSQIVNELESVSPEVLYVLYQYYSTVESSLNLHSLLWQLVSHWRQIQPMTHGGSLQKLGIPPGPIYRQLLERLRAAWLDGKVTNEVEEQALLRELLKELGSPIT